MPTGILFGIRCISTRFLWSGPAWDSLNIDQPPVLTLQIRKGQYVYKFSVLRESSFGFGNCNLLCMLPVGARRNSS